MSEDPLSEQREAAESEVSNAEPLEAAPVLEQQKFSFELSPQALAVAMVQCTELDKHFARAGRNLTLLLYAWVPPLVYFASLGGLLLWTYQARIGPELSVLSLLLIPLFPAGIVLAYLASPSGYVSRWQRKAMLHAKCTAALHSGLVEVIIDEHGVTYTDRWGTAKYGWHAIIKCVPTESAMAIHLAQQRVIVIPYSAFKDPNIVAYADRLTSAIAQRGGEAAAVQSLLRDFDAKCPKCGYNMRGSASPVCSECGNAIALDRLPVRIIAYRR